MRNVCRYTTLTMDCAKAKKYRTLIAAYKFTSCEIGIDLAAHSISMLSNTHWWQFASVSKFISVLSSPRREKWTLPSTNRRWRAHDSMTLTTIKVRNKNKCRELFFGVFMNSFLVPSIRSSSSSAAADCCQIVASNTETTTEKMLSSSEAQDISWWGTAQSTASGS